MRNNEFDVHELIQYLQGTCNTITEGLTICTTSQGMEEDDLTDADHDAIDDVIFLCEACGWWCEVSERSENDELCEDCY